MYILDGQVQIRDKLVFSLSDSAQLRAVELTPLIVCPLVACKLLIKIRLHLGQSGMPASTHSLAFGQFSRPRLHTDGAASTGSGRLHRQPVEDTVESIEAIRREQGCDTVSLFFRQACVEVQDSPLLPLR